jgi:hypothetical protein
MVMSRTGSCRILRMVAAIFVRPAWRMSPIARLRSVAGSGSGRGVRLHRISNDVGMKVFPACINAGPLRVS